MDYSGAHSNTSTRCQPAGPREWVWSNNCRTDHSRSFVSKYVALGIGCESHLVAHGCHGFVDHWKQSLCQKSSDDFLGPGNGCDVLRIFPQPPCLLASYSIVRWGHIKCHQRVADCSNCCGDPQCL